MSFKKVVKEKLENAPQHHFSFQYISTFLLNMYRQALSMCVYVQYMWIIILFCLKSGGAMDFDRLKIDICS